MNATTADCPTVSELDALSGLLAGTPIDRGGLVSALRRIELVLREHARELDETGGLLDEAEKASRMSLAREDDRLREELSTLLGGVEEFRRDAANGIEDDDFRRRGSELVAGLRGHRDAEARLVLESTDTDVGSGD